MDTGLNAVLFLSFAFPDHVERTVRSLWTDATRP
jgi:hypothetical protein